LSRIAFIYPGQGSQAVGMGKEFFDNYQVSREVFEESNDILGLDLMDMIFNGPKEALQQTENTQPALLVTSVAINRVLESEGISPAVVAGHSLGEFTAYVASGALSFAEGLRTVRKRGELMANADPEGKGAMAAIIGLDDDLVEEVCKSASDVGMVVPANYNCPGQVVISGEKPAVDKAIELAKERKARMAVPLDVSGAFHSPLIEAASHEFESFLNTIEVKSPAIPVISNVTADVVALDGVKASWVKQMLSSVLWKRSVDKMVEMGVDCFVEVGAGKVLQGLVKKSAKGVNIHGVDSIAALEKTLGNLK